MKWKCSECYYWCSQRVRWSERGCRPIRSRIHRRSNSCRCLDCTGSAQNHRSGYISVHSRCSRPNGGRAPSSASPLSVVRMLVENRNDQQHDVMIPWWKASQKRSNIDEIFPIAQIWCPRWVRPWLNTEWVFWQRFDAIAIYLKTVKARKWKA